MEYISTFFQNIRAERKLINGVDLGYEEQLKEVSSNSGIITIIYAFVMGIVGIFANELSHNIMSNVFVILLMFNALFMFKVRRFMKIKKIIEKI